MLSRDSTATRAQIFVQRIRKRKFITFTIPIILVIVIAFALFVFPGREPGRDELPPLRDPSSCTLSHSAPDGGDCQALGEMRRPKWACLSDMREEIPRFLKVYRHRPFKVNQGGMRMDHGTFLVASFFKSMGMSWDS